MEVINKGEANIRSYKQNRLQLERVAACRDRKMTLIADQLRSKRGVGREEKGRGGERVEKWWGEGIEKREGYK